MIPITSSLLGIGAGTMLMFLPLMCYLDWKYREVPWWLFFALAIVNVPITFLVYAAGWLPLTHAATSLAICLFAFAVWKLFGAGAFSAADRNLICCIALFFYWSPFNPALDAQYVPFIAMVYQLKFLVYLIVVMCVMPLCIFTFNMIAGYNKEYTIWEMVTKVPRGIPMIIPISVAYVIAMFWGI